LTAPAGSQDTSVDGRIRISVADTGLGISEDELGKVFDEFQRSNDGSRTCAAAPGSA
jgi:signal transduction histidine kinase